MSLSRRNFFKRIAPVAAVAPIALGDGKQAFDLKPGKKYLIVCDSNQVTFHSIVYLKESLDRMGIESMVIGNDNMEALKLYELES
jgi:hypothetical protein